MEGQGSRSNVTRWLPLFLVAAGAVVYWNSLEGAFVNDDRRWILQDPEIRSLANWRAILSDTPRPLLKLTLALNYAVGGHDVTGYHLVNVAVHLLAGLVLYGALRRTPGCPLWLAFASALLWMVHPLQTQAVTYVIQRGESIMGLFYLLTLYGSIRCATGPRRPLWVAVALIACGLGLGAKEVMVTAPFMVLLYDRTFLAGSFTRAVTERRALYLGLAIVWAGALFGAIGARALLAGEFVRPDLPTVGPVAYALTQPQVILQYLKLVVWPHPLCFDYNWPAATSAAEILPAALVVTALLGATLYALWRRSWLGFAGAWFFGILAPTSSVFPIQDLAVEHRMYLPLASPVVLLVAVAYGVLAPAGRARAALACVLLAAVTASLGAATVSRNRDYRSRVALRGSVVVAVPESARGHYNYGTELKTANRLDEAIRELRLAVELDPRYAEAHHNLANALRATGQVDEAIGHYRLAIAAYPDHGGARTNLANSLRSQGRDEEALVEYRAAVERNPRDARAQYNLAAVLGEQGDLDGAIEGYRRALALRPRHVPTHNNHGLALRRQGDLAGALAHHREAVRIDPRHHGAHRNLGIDLEARGEREEAIVHYRRALEIEPGDTRARDLLEAARAPGAVP